jgi:hypothetical protein
MIKKIFFSLVAIIALASCSGDGYTGWADPQSNDPEEAQTVVMAVEQAPAIDFANIVDLDNTPVQLFIPSVSTQTASITTYKVTLLNGEDEVELDADENGMVSAAILKLAVEELYGKAPTPHDIPLDIAGYTTIAGVSVKNVATSTINVTLVAPFIDEGYYLTGDFAGWNKDGALPFNHVGDGDVYDNPEFQIVFTTTAANQYWKIIPKNNYDGDFWKEGEQGVVGVATDGDTSFEGTLVTNSPQAGKIEAPGIYRMTINMMDYTYKLEALNFAPFVYFIGATDGWSGDDQRLATSSFDGKYTGYVYVADPNNWGLEFKFRSIKGTWDNEINSGTFTAGITGDFADGGGNIKATAGEGIYYVEMDLANYTLKGTKITSMGLVGDFNGWNPGDPAQKMTWDATNYCYVISGATVTAAGWKFTANDAWDINLGGNDTTEPSMVITDLVGNGKNLGVVGNTIKLYPCRNVYDNIYCTIQ